MNARSCGCPIRAGQCFAPRGTHDPHPPVAGDLRRHPDRVPESCRRGWHLHGDRPRPRPGPATHSDAAVAEGHRGLFRIDLDSQPGNTGTHVYYDCASPNDVNRTVWLWPGQVTADTMTVEGTMRLVWHPRSKDGQFAGFWEYRLMDAVRVK
jgi:hypothetical protein